MNLLIVTYQVFGLSRFQSYSRNCGWIEREPMTKHALDDFSLMNRWSRSLEYSAQQ